MHWLVFSPAASQERTGPTYLITMMSVSVCACLLARLHFFSDFLKDSH